MISAQNTNSVKVNLSSEIGRLNAVLLHRPGIEIERMTPENASKALYNDILNKHIVDTEYNNFCGVFERYAKVFYVKDLVHHLLDDTEIREYLVRKSCEIEGCDFLAYELLQLDNNRLADILIEGYEYRQGFYPEQYANERYILKPLYNLFFTRDAASSIYDRVLINSMSFQVRRRETLLYETIFQRYFGAQTLNPQLLNPEAHTEGGDVQIAREDLLCIGQGIRTNGNGIKYLAEKFASEREHFNIIVQELPKQPESFIHLDMVFTFLGQHQCMMYEPMLRHQGNFATKHTTLITIDHGQIHYDEQPDLLQALHTVGIDVEPVFCGGSDPWNQQREQWHSGSNFFAVAPYKIIGYERNTHTIDALAKAGFAILDAEKVCNGTQNIEDYEKCVVTFRASELPRGGGGARCMTMPINRQAVDWNK